MFKHTISPGLNPTIASNLQKFVLGTLEDEDVRSILVYPDAEYTHDWWDTNMTKDLPNLKTYILKPSALIDNQLGFSYTRKKESPELDEQNLYIDQAFMTVCEQGEYTTWHSDYAYKKSIVVFLSDQEEGSGEFEYVNAYADLGNEPHPANNPNLESIKIVPAFNQWVEFDNPDNLGCWHRTTPNLSTEPRISLTIFFNEKQPL